MEKRLKKYLVNGKFDKVTASRSKIMAAIAGKNNKSTELRLRMYFVRAGIKGWVLHPKSIIGNPDFYFSIPRIAIFVDGCFWHGCPKCGHIPKTRAQFWDAKIKRNKLRDKQISSNLKKQGIFVLRFWEHELNTRDCIVPIISRINKE